MASPVAAEEAAPTAAGQAAPAAADVAEVRDEAAEPGCLDLRAFPRFAPLLASTQEYAQLTGCRFQSDSLCSLSSFLLSADLSTGSGEPQSQRAELLAAKRRAAPTVLEFTERLKLGEEGLMEELEKASRMVMSESVRRGVVATAQNLCMWPPDPPPASVAEGDCSYEDTSAPMDAIAQRARSSQHKLTFRGWPVGATTAGSSGNFAFGPRDGSGVEFELHLFQLVLLRSTFGGPRSCCSAAPGGLPSWALRAREAGPAPIPEVRAELPTVLCSNLWSTHGIQDPFERGRGSGVRAVRRGAPWPGRPLRSFVSAPTGSCMP
ncbi:unnamed protein product [Prorocentrum cordatum]|uniref:Uncharacterized protein n=1 Tax=Prorocentrum cordatum TaxID=2364126 RepID=A0ABN9VGJ3_9DINO|nr:unnamed protein product [Polarella glacialis]